MIGRLFTAPFQGLLWIFQEVAERAEAELNDDKAVREELVRLYHELEAGAITEEQFGVRETELLERLEAIEEHERRMSDDDDE